MRPEPALPTRVRVRVEVPRGSLAKRGAHGQIEFLSPVPCPFHYGSVVGVLGADGAGGADENVPTVELHAHAGVGQAVELARPRPDHEAR